MVAWARKGSSRKSPMGRVPGDPQIDPRIKAEIDEGLREFRMMGEAINPMYPVRLSLLDYGPLALSVQVTINDADAPVPVFYDHQFRFVLNQFGALDIQSTEWQLMRWPQTLGLGVWNFLYEVPKLESPCFIWCIRREQNDGDSAERQLNMYVRWLAGRFLWRS